MYVCTLVIDTMSMGLHAAHIAIKVLCLYLKDSVRYLIFHNTQKHAETCRNMFRYLKVITYVIAFIVEYG